MAQRALTQWIEYLSSKDESIPTASDIRTVEAPEAGFVNLVNADVRDSRAVKRTVSLPRWMDTAAIDAGLSLSKVLQDALSIRLN